MRQDKPQRVLEMIVWPVSARPLGANSHEEARMMAVEQICLRLLQSLHPTDEQPNGHERGQRQQKKTRRLSQWWTSLERWLA